MSDTDFESLNFAELRDSVRRAGFDMTEEAFVLSEAARLREYAERAYAAAKEEPDFDPGDARLYVNGRSYWVTSVLDILEAIGLQVTR